MVTCKQVMLAFMDLAAKLNTTYVCALIKGLKPCGDRHIVLIA